jgi:ABC-type transport system substrate-binding protein
MACNPDLDKRAADARQTLLTDPGMAQQKWREIYAAVDQDARVIPYSNETFDVLISPRVGNYTSSPLRGPELDQLWVK